MKRILKTLWTSKSFAMSLTRIAVMLIIGLLITVMFFEDKFIYYPAKYPEGDWQIDDFAREGEVIPLIEDCYFQTTDGVKLHGWFCSPQRKAGGAMERVQTAMTLLWFHGNAGNLSHRYDMLRALIKLPAQIFIIDYRGYGRSEGSPSEEGLYADARAAWDYLTAERGIAPEKIIIFGKSLGGAAAIDLAAKVEAAGLIVQSSFTSAADMAAQIMPFIPRALIKTRMDSINKIARVRCAKLFIHSPTDEVVPYELGLRLFETAPEPKQFYEVKRARHNDTWIAGGKDYFEALRTFVESCAPRQ
ncbi:MAG: alpha/beta hydrolase [Acidobacteriota bacterium]